LRSDPAVAAARAVPR